MVKRKIRFKRLADAIAKETPAVQDRIVVHSDKLAAKRDEAMLKAKGVLTMEEVGDLMAQTKARQKEQAWLERVRSEFIPGLGKTDAAALRKIIRSTEKYGFKLMIRSLEDGSAVSISWNSRKFNVRLDDDDEPCD